MTTIAWRDRMLAADGLSTNGGWATPGQTPKLVRLKDGRIGGGCGTYAEVLRLLDWIDAGENGKQPEGDVTVVVMNAAGVVTCYESGAKFRTNDTFGAVGTGMPVALGAMHAGADAFEAVRIATLVDIHSGGQVSFLRPVSPQND